MVLAIPDIIICCQTGQVTLSFAMYFYCMYDMSTCWLRKWTHSNNLQYFLSSYVFTARGLWWPWKKHYR